MLTTQQLVVISALSSGATVTAAAQEAGVHRNTINNWRRDCVAFKVALSDAQYDRALYFRERCEGLVDLAMNAIQEILADPKTPASVRLRAALAITQIAAAPPAPKKPVELAITDLIQPVPASPAQTDPKMMKSAKQEPPAPQPSAQTPQKVMNSVQPPTPKVGRNEPCPCGSGQKF